jgi:dipeptidyl aminopeptidase/acylaminoacyl peptidase
MIRVYVVFLCCCWCLPFHLKAAENLGEDFKTVGIPEIGQELSQKFERYLQIRSVKGIDWAPDGALLVLTGLGEYYQVHRVPFAGGRREQLTFFDGSVSWAMHCPVKKCDYVLMAQESKIIRFDLSSKTGVLLADDNSQKFIWNPAGDRVAYSSNQRDENDFDIYLMDPKQPDKREMILQGKGLWWPLDFSPDGKSLLVMNYLTGNRSHVYLVDLVSKTLKPLTPENEQEFSYSQALFSKDGKQVWLTTNRSWEFFRMAKVDISKDTFNPVYLTEKTDWDVTQFALSPDGREYAYLVNAGGVSKLYVGKTRKPERAKLVPMPAGVVSKLKYSPDGKRLAFIFENHQIAADVFVFEPKKNKLERWTYSEMGELRAEEFVAPQLVTFSTFDIELEGPRQIPAWLYLPPNKFKPPYPVLVVFNQEPESQAQPSFLGQDNFMLAEMGMAIIRPNLRGSAGYGKNYLALDNQKRREDTVRDVGALLEWIEKHPELDSSRVAVMGASYGGYLALAGLAIYADQIRCGVIAGGIFNFISYLENTKSYLRDARRFEYGDEREESTRIYLDMISPESSLARIQKPVLVLQRSGDSWNSTIEADQLVKNMKNQDKVVWYLETLAHDEDEDDRDYTQTVVFQFLGEYL